MEPVRRVRISEGVVDAIIEMIADDGFAPGDKFYSENELTAKLKVSRSSIREAVRILEANGRLSVQHGKGIFILDTDCHSFDAFVSWLKNNDRSLQEHFEVRLIIEPQTARLAALGVTPKEIAALEDVHARFVANARLKLTAEAIQCDREFHKLLGKATQNKILTALTRSMTTTMLDDWISSLHTPGRIEKTVGEHGLVLEAIKKGDAEAAKEHMAAHLRNAMRDIRDIKETLSS